MKNSQVKWREHPILYEINTWPWLTELSERYNKKIIFDNIPEEIIHNYLKKFDVIWLMGVWERSPASERIAREEPNLQKEYGRALDHIKEEDIVGSPYAVYYYHVNEDLGGKKGLIDFREKLHDNNINIILDFVPNHVARDHIWTLEKSNLFIEGTFDDMNSEPDSYFSSYGRVLAHGKDPYFPPWTDTVQINAFSPEARKKAINTLKSIAEICDGVRCDMAMLVTNDIFKKNWGERVGNPPEKDFWEEIIPSIKQEYPDFKFIGEVYWDMEWELMQQGFDYCYDKRLYDKIVGKNISEIKSHLNADYDYQKKLVRFLENHDEPRVIDKLDKELTQAAAILILTLPGMGLIYEGQMKGYKIRVPVQLKRRKQEEIDTKLFDFYIHLLSIISEKKIKSKNWENCSISNQDGNLKKNLVAYHWWDNENHFLIVINFEESKVNARIHIPTIDYHSEKIMIYDLLSETELKVSKSEIKNNGLNIELSGWKGQIFEVKNR